MTKDQEKRNSRRQKLWTKVYVKALDKKSAVFAGIDADHAVRLFDESFPVPPHCSDPR